MTMQYSTVKWFDAKKGYGFINHPDGGDDVFVHYSQIQSDDEFKTLRTGQSVQFEMNDGPKGLHALNVEALDEEGEEADEAASSAEPADPMEEVDPMEEAGMDAPPSPAGGPATGEPARDPRPDAPSPGIPSPTQEDTSSTEYGTDSDLSGRAY